MSIPVDDFPKPKAMGKDTKKDAHSDVLSRKRGKSAVIFGSARKIFGDS